jgi:RHS repeat-associated protein
MSSRRGRFRRRSRRAPRELRRSPPQYRLITWKSYNLPLSVSENGLSMTFSYGADRQRFRQVNGFDNKTTLYVDGLYEKEITGSFAKHVNYIFAAGRAVAVLNSATDNTTSMQYLHRDHLGSVTHLTNQAGGVVETLSYDLWGKRRNADWSDPISPPPSAQSQRGFTGHEMLDDVNVVHMNGRVYDASLGKMLSADPYVQFPTYSQSFNRYSYVLNNPGSYTDPSGFCIAGFACPTAGFSGFTKGLAASLNRAGLARSGLTVVTSSFRAFSGGAFLGSFQWGGGLGSASCIVQGPACEPPWIMHYAGDSWRRGDPFGGFRSLLSAWLSMMASQQTYVYANANVDRPDGQGGSDALHALAVNERNFVGPTVSPVLSDDAANHTDPSLMGQVAAGPEAPTFTRWFGKKPLPPQYHAGFSVDDFMNEHRIPLRINEQGWRHHRYRDRTPICKLSARCTPAAIFEMLKRYPAPGVDHTVAVSPDRQSELTGGNPVRHRFDVRRLTIVNLTTPEHVLHDGFVLRTVVTWNGMVAIETYGEGVNRTGAWSIVNTLTGPLIFDFQDTQLKNEFCGGSENFIC